MMMPREVRTKMLNFVVNESEEHEIRQKMQTLGIKNQSAFLRSLVLNGYAIKVEYPMTELRETIRLLQNMTNNLNQIAKRVNAGGKIYETELEEIKDNQRTLWDMMNRILR